MSKLEDELAFAMRAIGLPEPEREYRFMWCCPHPRRAHKVDQGIVTVRGGMVDIAWCLDCDIESCEHQYSHERQWRADFAWPELRILVEVEGGVYTNGRHVRGRGYEKDAEKYSTASLAGWTVLRFTGRQVKSGEALSMIEKALKGEAG